MASSAPPVPRTITARLSRPLRRRAAATGLRQGKHHDGFVFFFFVANQDRVQNGKKDQTTVGSRIQMTLLLLNKVLRPIYIWCHRTDKIIPCTEDYTKLVFRCIQIALNRPCMPMLYMTVGSPLNSIRGARTISCHEEAYIYEHTDPHKHETVFIVA
ncbi:hypothetical protein BRADI_1g33014v3 [Brachypodium distachyon]|uniref:Uncharacterized protein n=1 Tax=Brachypodium distachyon TaxID=15368 RepID=A0A2K2DMF7_BRADI|nr:hypothetical protein BRADI_1g33014v3 [Brachypodium distachyon]PNT75468.1 hypothetical protein BRADI_1g33014v3 [Brachypodium distachyon]